MTLHRYALLPALLLLAACSGSDVSNTLGLNKRAPDEFVVVSRPPLVVPPEFDLSPPRPGEEPPHAISTQEQARGLLLGTASDRPSLDEFLDTGDGTPAVDTAVVPVIASDAPTAASANFLKRLGADAADPAIRRTLREERSKPQPMKEAGSLYEEIMGGEAQETIVDAAKESERLRTNKDAGKPVTEGDTPVKDTTPKSVLEKVF